MSNHEEKLAPFAELVADPEVPAKKIAELADVPEKAVAAARKALAQAAEPEPPLATEPVTEPEVEPAPEPAQAPPADDDTDEQPRRVPHAVKVTAKAMLRTETGRPWRVGRGDVYSGPKAAFLWRHHRELVVEFGVSISL